MQSSSTAAPSPLSGCIFALSNRSTSVSVSSRATNAAAALLQQPAAAQPGQAASMHASDVGQTLRPHGTYAAQCKFMWQVRAAATTQ